MPDGCRSAWRWGSRSGLGTTTGGPAARRSGAPGTPRWAATPSWSTWPGMTPGSRPGGMLAGWARTGSWSPALTCGCVSGSAPPGKAPGTTSRKSRSSAPRSRSSRRRRWPPRPVASPFSRSTRNDGRWPGRASGVAPDRDNGGTTMTEQTHVDLGAAGVPQDAMRRLAELQPAKPGAILTPDLSVNEFLLLREAGFRPLGLVLGSSIYHVGLQVGRWGKNQELDVLSQAM